MGFSVVFHKMVVAVLEHEVLKKKLMLFRKQLKLFPYVLLVLLVMDLQTIKSNVRGNSWSVTYHNVGKYVEAQSVGR